MTIFTLWLACSSPEPITTGELDVTEPVVTEPVSTNVTTTDTATKVTEEELVPAVIEPAAPEGARLVISGVAGMCEGAEVWLRLEFLGVADTVVATPWLDGIAGDNIELTFNNDSLFHMAEQRLVVDDCEATTWLWTLEGAGGTSCAVSGPDAESVIASLPAPCQHR